MSLAEAVGVPARLSGRVGRTRAGRSKRGVIGVVIIGVVVMAAVFADQIAPYDPIRTSLADRLRPPGFTPEAGPAHLFGTDQLGRDLLSRVIHGARISLLVGFVSVALAGAVGVGLGLTSGYYGGMWDQITMRWVDVQLAFPSVVLAIAVLAIFGNSFINVIVVLAMASWVVYARLVRGLTLSIREKEYVEGARAIGCRDSRILARYILPNALPAIVVIATYQFAVMIIAESGLSFLGLGVPPPAPTWGAGINAGRDYLAQAWWVTTFPGLALMITIMGATFLGDWAREALDPTVRV